MNFKTIELKEIIIVVMSIVQKCYNSPLFTCLAHSNPSNKIEYVQWEQEPPRRGLTTNVLSSLIVL
jgi:hypothetical protein